MNFALTHDAVRLRLVKMRDVKALERLILSPYLVGVLSLKR